MLKKIEEFLKELGFVVVPFDEIIDFSGSCKNEDGQVCDAEGSIEYYEDGTISYSVSIVVDGEELPPDYNTVQVNDDNFRSVVMDIVAPNFM